MWGGLHDQSIIWTHPQWFVRDFFSHYCGAPNHPTSHWRHFEDLYSPAKKTGFIHPSIGGSHEQILKVPIFWPGEKLWGGGAGVMMCIPWQHCSHILRYIMIKGCSITSETHTPPKINIEPQNNGLEDDFPGQGGILRFHVNLLGCSL